MWPKSRREFLLNLTWWGSN